MAHEYEEGVASRPGEDGARKYGEGASRRLGQGAHRPVEAVHRQGRGLVTQRKSDADGLDLDDLDGVDGGGLVEFGPCCCGWRRCAVLWSLVLVVVFGECFLLLKLREARKVWQLLDALKV